MVFTRRFGQTSRRSLLQHESVYVWGEWRTCRTEHVFDAHRGGQCAADSPDPSSVELNHRALSGQELAESNKFNQNGTNSKGKLFIPAL